MAYRRPTTNYRPLQYTPQSYSPLNYEPTPQTQTQPDEDFYRKLLEGTKAPTPPPEPDPAFEYQKRYQDIAGRTPNRLAYQQAVQEGYPEIQRDKLSKALAIIGAVGGTWATKDPAASTRAAMEAYNAPQARASARYKEKLTGLENLATMEDKDIAGKIRALEFERGDFYDQQRLKLDRERSARETKSDERDIIGDEQERERRQIALDELKLEKKIDPHTGVEYTRKRGTNDPWVARDKPKLSRAEEIMYDALAKGEEEKALEAAKQPGRDKAAAAITNRQVTIQEMRGATTLKARLLKEANTPGVSEVYRQRRMNFLTAVDNDPTLAKYIKYDDAKEPQIKTIEEVTWGDPEPEDVLGIEKLRAAVMAGRPVSAGPPIPVIDPKTQEIKHISAESWPYWEGQGFKKAPPGSVPNYNKAAGAPAAAANVTALPKNANGKIDMIDPDGVEFEANSEEEARHMLSLNPPARLKNAGTQASPIAATAAAGPAQSTAAPTTTTTVTPEAPKPASVAPPQEPVNPYASIEETNVEEGATLSSGFPYANQGFPKLGNTFGQPYQRTNIPRPASNPFANMAQDATVEPIPGPPAPMPTGPDPNAGMPISNRIMQNRFGPANLFGANIPLPGANPQQRMPPPQAPAPPIDLMPKPQPQRTPPPPIVPPQQAPLPPNPIQLAPAVNAPAVPPPQAPITEAQGVQFGPVPNNQMNRTPFGQASQLTSPLTNPLMLSGGMDSMDIKIPKPTPKPLAPGSRTPIPPRLAIPERVKDFNTRLESLKAQFKQETGYDIRIDRGGDVTEVEQYKKYLQGRPELPGGTKGSKVTPISGKPGDESTHQYGEGADVIFTKDGKMAPYVDRTKKHQPPNKLGERLYAILGRIAEQKGLEWGGRWKGDRVDFPHVQLPDLKKKTDTASSKGRK